MKTSLRTAILVSLTVPLVGTSTLMGRDLRPMLVESGPVQLSPAPAVVAATPVAAKALLFVTPVVAPVVSPVVITSPVVTTPAPVGPSIIIYPTTPIIFPTNPISLP